MDARNTIEVAQVFEEGGSQSELDRRADGLKEVQKLFIKKGDEYFFNDVPTIVAFSESDNQISTDLDSRHVADAMVLLAQSKGWQLYTVEGSDVFYKAIEEKTEELTAEWEQLQDREVFEQAKDTSIAPKAIESGSADVDNTEEVDQTKKKSTPVELSSSQEQSEPTKDTSTLANVIESKNVKVDSTEADTARKKALIASVSNQYRIAGNEYYFKDQGGNVDKLAFKDTGKSLSTSLNSDRVTKSLVELAESKGWDDIKVTGHKDFKRQVFRSAAERGITVRGYTPDADDITFVESRKKQNTIQPVSSREGTKEVVSDNGTRQQPENENSGTLVAHGVAPYRNDKDNSDSYFVTVANGNKENTSWGLDLEKAVNDSGVKVGDKVKLEKVEERYKVSGKRNTWNIENAERAEVITAVATAVASEKIGNASDRQRVVEAVKSRVEATNADLPDVNMYDNDAAKTRLVENSKNRQKTPELTR